MTNRIYILPIFFILVLICGAGVTAAPPIPFDDAYYVSGDEMRALNMRIDQQDTNQQDSLTTTAPPPCQTTIVFTSVKDTTVTAVINRCPKTP